MKIKKIISEIYFKNLSLCSYEETLTLLKIRNELEIRKNSFNKHKISLKEHNNWLKKNIEKKDLKNFIVFNKREIIGNINIYNLTNNSSSKFWSFYVGKKHRKVGVGFALEYKTLNLIFDEMFIELINCFVLNTNTEVIKLHKKFGFKEINTKEETIIPKGFEKKTTQLILNKKNWIKIKKNFEKKFLLV